MSKIRVTIERLDVDTEAVLETTDRILDMSEPDICGDLGCEIFAEYVLATDSVEGIGGRPKNRPSPSA